MTRLHILRCAGNAAKNHEDDDKPRVNEDCRMRDQALRYYAKT